MAEEKRKTAVEEENKAIQSQQVTLVARFAQGMHLSPAALATVTRCDTPARAIGILMCAVDGMDDAELKGMESFTTTEILDRRQEYLQEKNAPFSELRKRVESLDGEVKKELAQSREARNALEQGIERAWAAQREAQDQLLRSKDEMIGILRGQIRDLQKKAAKMAQEKEAGEETSARDVLPEKKQSRPKSGKQAADETKAVTADQSSIDILKKAVPPVLEQNVISEDEDAHPVSAESQGIFGRLWGSRKRNEEAKKFISQYLEDEEMSDEQKEYLLSCMENGVTLREMEKFASPKLSVEQMERLRKIQSQT